MYRHLLAGVSLLALAAAEMLIVRPDGWGAGLALSGRKD